jgi:hypothetical protein
MARIVGSVIFVLFAVAPLHSQVRFDVRGSFGASKSFLDEPFAGIGGGSVVLNLGPRVGIGPEYLYTRVNGFRIHSFSVTGIYTLSPWTANITTYLGGAIGVIRDHDVRINFTAKQLNASANAGLRLSLSRAFIAPEVRFGSYSFPTALIHLGYSF